MKDVIQGQRETHKLVFSGFKVSKHCRSYTFIAVLSKTNKDTNGQKSIQKN